MMFEREDNRVGWIEDEKLTVKPLYSVDRKRAVTYAQSQIGGPYGHGVGPKPEVSDCSGLVLSAWKMAGVTIPWNSAAQFDYHQNPYVRVVSNTRANRKLLQPGDLVAYYPGISHVALFEKVTVVGNRVHYMVLQATNEARGIERIRMYAYAEPVALGFMGH